MYFPIEAYVKWSAR